MRRVLFLVALLSAPGCNGLLGIHQPTDRAPDGGSSPTGQGGSGDGGTVACDNPCTAGATQCAAAGVQTCKVQANGCTAWVTTTTCGASQECMVKGTTASCTCPDSICTQLGTVCQDGQTVATCARNANGCLYVMSTSTCAPPMSCAGDSPSAACSSTCTNTCMPGQASCVNGALATCTLGTNGCYAYSAPVGCGTHQSCTGAAGSAKCMCKQDPLCAAAGPTCASATTLAICSQDSDGCNVASSNTPCTGGACTGAAGNAACCTNACAAGATQCAVGAVQTCVLQSNGCTAWATTKTCGAQQSCTVSAGKAGCNCAASICTRAGTVCQDGQTVATCGMDADGCPVVSSTAKCAAPESCSGTAPNAQCSLTCANSCTMAQKTCVTGSLATCTMGSNGCLSFGTPVACAAHQSCTGPSGSASCTCNADPVCTGTTGPTCSSSTLVTCSKDANGCNIQGTSATCTNGACTGAAGAASCCTNACTAGGTQCASGAMQTCRVQSNGCTAWVTTQTCGTNQTCTVTAGTAACTCKTSICTGNGTMCQNGTTVATCATDTNSCRFVSTTQSCTSPQVCTGSAPSATCGLTCTNTCTQGQKSCVNGGLATCGVGTNGCLSFGAPVGCAAHESCAGPSGGASCQCVGDSVCTGTTGPTCSGSTVVTCAKDATTGCNFQMSTQTCTNGACSGAAGKAMCCTNACTVNGKQCAAGGVVQTCQVDTTTGCTKWVPTSTCGTNQVCTGAGQCPCSATTTSCSGACVNINGNDSANCGACGHSCAPGICAMGKCQPWLVAGPPTTGSIVRMVTDGTSVVWFDNVSRQVRQVPANGGGGVTVLGQGDSATSGQQGNLALANGIIVWNDQHANGDEPILSGRLGQTSTLRFTVSNLEFGGFALDPTGTTLYMSVFGASPTLMKCVLATGACTTFDTPTWGPLAVNSNFAFFTNGSIDRFNLATNAIDTFPTAILQSITSLFGIALDASNAYWSVASGDGTGRQDMESIPLGGGATRELVAWMPPLSLVDTPPTTDGRFVYFASFTLQQAMPGAISYVSVSGGTSLSTLASSSDQLQYPRAAGGAVYYVDLQANTINGVRTPP